MGRAELLEQQLGILQGLVMAARQTSLGFESIGQMRFQASVGAIVPMKNTEIHKKSIH